MKWTMLIVLMAAGIVHAQLSPEEAERKLRERQAMVPATRPSSAPMIIAQLKDENARLKREVAELRAEIEKFIPPRIAVAEFASLEAMIKTIPRKLLHGGSTEVQERQNQDWYEHNLIGKAICISAEMREAKIDEIGRITLLMEAPDEISPMRRQIIAKFNGTAEQRQAIARLEPDQLVNLSGTIAAFQSEFAMLWSKGQQQPRPGCSMTIELDACQLAK